MISFALIISSLVMPTIVFAEENGENAGGYTDGIYEGTGRGRNGNITVSVVIENGSMVSAEVISHNETPEYWEYLLDEDGSNFLISDMITAQSSDVDDVTGATKSSRGLREAVADALRKASGGEEPADPGADDPEEIDEGIFDSGTGSAEDPYIINTAEQLAAFAGSLNSKIDYTGKHVMLGSDVDISGQDWAPVGGSFYRFNGEFDGNGMTITGLTEGTLEEPLELSGSNAYIGLFGWINENAYIHDLDLANVAVYSHSAGSAYIGGVAGRMSGSDTEGNYHGACIDNCTVSGVISHVTERGTTFAGGITGHMFKGTVINCFTDVDMDLRELSGELAECGGIAGLLNRGLIANSCALGNLTGSGYRNTQNDIEGMACVGNIAAVDGGYIANCYGGGNVEALEYSIDTGILAGWVTGIGKAYNCWYNEKARMVIDGRVVTPVDPFGETVAGGVSDEWGFRFPGSMTDRISGYVPGKMSDVADGLNASFDAFPVDIEGLYGLEPDALRKWTFTGDILAPRGEHCKATYVRPEIEKNSGDEEALELQDGKWYGRSRDESCIVAIDVANEDVLHTEILKGKAGTEAYKEAVSRAAYKSKFGDTSNYEPADTGVFKGSGTEKDPYRIENESQLRYLAESINEDVDWNGIYFRQTGNITVSDKEWKPIGYGIFADADGDGFGQDLIALYPFRGIYDGGDYTISGLRAGSSENPVHGNYMGLFGMIQGDYEGNEIPEDGRCAILRNIRVRDVSFYTKSNWRSYCSGLTANAQGGFVIDNCSATGSVSAESTDDFAFAGGLTGSLMYGCVKNCWTDVDCNSWSGKNYSYAAGMSSVTNRATIVNSYALGDVHADADQTNRAEAGGFTALDGGICVNCYARGDVESVSKYSMYVGGFSGMAASSSEHRQCYYNTDASQKAAGKELDEKRYAGKFVNESAESAEQAKTGADMSSPEFCRILEDNRKNVSEVVSQIRRTLGADDSGSSRYHSIYYNGDGTDLLKWQISEGIASFGQDESERRSELEEELYRTNDKLTALTTLIAALMADKPQASKYTTASYARFEKSQKKAVAVLNDSEAEPEDIYNAAQAVSKARSGLVLKKAQKLIVKAKDVRVSAKKLRRKAVTVSSARIFRTNGAKGKIKYAKLSGNKKIAVLSDGKIRIAKGTKKGTYRIKIKVTASGNGNYKAASRTLTLKVIVKR